MFIAIGTGSFMAALDGSVVNTILPVLRDAFNSDVATIEWVVTIYLLVLSGLLLTFGRLGDLRGHRSVYVWGFGIFVASSALCGAAWSAGTADRCSAGCRPSAGRCWLRIRRPSSPATSPPSERGRAFGLVSTMTYLGLTVGPSLGGWLTQAFGWRTVFYINVPVGLLALTLSLIFIPKDAPAESEKRFDLPGAAVFLAGLTALLLGLNKGADWGWTSPSVLGLLAGAAAFLAVFILIERRSSASHAGPEPVPRPAVLHLHPQRDSKLHLPVQHHLSDAVLPDPGPRIESRPGRPAADRPAGVDGDHRAGQRHLSDRVGSRVPGMLGMGVLAGGLLLLSRLGPGSELWLVALGLAIAGAGTGMFISPNTSALMGAAPRAQAGNRLGRPGDGAQLRHGAGHRAGRGHLHHPSGAELSEEAFYAGIDQGFLVAAGIAVLGVVVSAVKDELKPGRNKCGAVLKYA